MSFIRRQRRRIRSLYYEYRRAFWILVGVSFIDRLGGALLFPFFALYITSKFNVGMSEVGVLFALFVVSSAIGSTRGGAVTDRWGRKRMIIFSLLSSSLSTLLMGLVDTLSAFYVLALVSGIFTDTGGPAYEAMTADLLPESKRAEGFGIIRVALNLAVAIGPLVGGLHNHWHGCCQLLPIPLPIPVFLFGISSQRAQSDAEFLSFQHLFLAHDRYLQHFRRYRRRQLLDVLERHGLHVEESFCFYATLFAWRSLEAALSRVVGEFEPRGIGDWRFGLRHPLTVLVRAVLDLDNRVCRALTRLGLAVPGLSLCAVCKNTSA